MSKLPEKLEKLRTKHNLQRDDFWQAHGQWCIKHKACEKIEDDLKVCWKEPTIIEQDSSKAVSMIVIGSVGDVTKWSTGEASPKNNKNAYPWAMAEKRGKDRVVLKLAGVAGDVYSEEEADDFKASRPEQPAPAPRGEVTPLDNNGRTNKEMRAEFDRILTPLTQCGTLQDLADWKNMFSEDLEKLPEDFRESLRGDYARKRDELKAIAA